MCKGFDMALSVSVPTILMWAAVWYLTWNLNPLVWFCLLGLIHFPRYFEIKHVYRGSFGFSAQHGLIMFKIEFVAPWPNKSYNPDPRNPDQISLDTISPDLINPDPISPDPKEPEPINPNLKNPDLKNPNPINPNPINPNPINPSSSRTYELLV